MEYVFCGIIGLVLLFIPVCVYFPIAETMSKPTKEQRMASFENGTDLPVRKKDKNVAVMLAMVLGSFGIHKAYLTREGGIPTATSNRNAKMSRDCSNGLARFCISEFSLFFAFLFGLSADSGGSVAFFLIVFLVMVGLGIKDGCVLSAMDEDEFQKIYSTTELTYQMKYKK